MASLGCEGAQLGEEPALSDARLADEFQRGGASALERRESAIHFSELAGASDEPLPEHGHVP